MKKMFIKLVLFFALVALLIFTAFYSGIVVRHYTLDSKLVKNGRGDEDSPYLRPSRVYIRRQAGCVDKKVVRTVFYVFV